MTDSLVIASRFCARRTAATAATYAGASLPISMAPQRSRCAAASLAKPMTVDRDGQGSVRVLRGGTMVAEGACLPAGPAIEVPGPVWIPEARAASAAAECGPTRRTPLPDLLGSGPDAGRATDCASGRTGARAAASRLMSGLPMIRSRSRWLCPARVLVGGARLRGQLRGCRRYRPPVARQSCWAGSAARQVAPVKSREPHRVVGWRLAADGRKTTTGSAVFTATGQAAGVARATWIRLR